MEKSKDLVVKMFTIKNLNIEVLKYLPVDDLYNTSLCNRYLANLINEDEMWRRKLENDAEILVEVKPGDWSFRDYKVLAVAPGLCAMFFYDFGLEESKKMVEKIFRNGKVVNDFHKTYIEFFTTRSDETFQTIKLKCWVMDTMIPLIQDEYKEGYIKYFLELAMDYDESLFLTRKLLNMGAKTKKISEYLKVSVGKIGLLNEYGLEIPREIFETQFKHDLDIPRVYQIFSKLLEIGLRPNDNMFADMMWWLDRMNDPNEGLALYQLLAKYGCFPRSNLLDWMSKMPKVYDFLKSIGRHD